MPAWTCSPVCISRTVSCSFRQPVVAEVGYLLNRDAGAEVEALFLTALADGDFTPVELVAVDYRRAAELVTTYGDLPLGTTDATVIALSERLGVGEVATLDHRHFRVVRPRMLRR